MAERRLHGLQRVLGANELSSTAYGTVGASMYYILGLVAAYALGLTPLVFVLAGVFFFCTAATYAEATAMFPEAGGSASFARRAFGEVWSFLAAWGHMLGYVMAIALALLFLPHYLGSLFDWLEPLRSSPGDTLFAIAAVALLVAVNVTGARETAPLNMVLAGLDLLTQLVVVAAGAVLVLSPDTLVDNVRMGAAPAWDDLLLAIPLGMVAYAGIATIANMAEEARDEQRTIPTAIGRVRVAALVVSITLPLIALSALPVTRTADGGAVTQLGVTEEDGGHRGDPVLGVVQELGLGALQGPAEVYVALLATAILLLAANAGLVGVSRLVYAMGVHRQVPDRLRELHPRLGTPWLGIVVFGAAAVVALIPGDGLFLGKMYAFGAMLAFSIAHLSVIRLRIAEPDRERPYRGPGVLRVGGRELPLFALVGLVGTAVSFVLVTVLSPAVAVVGGLWLVGGLALYAGYRRAHGLDLTSTVKVATPQPAIPHEAEYESILVAFESGHYVPDVVATAVKLAARRRRGIHVLVTVTVPNSSPIDAEMPEQELAAQAIIEQAKLVGGRRVSGHVEKVRAGQAGRLIVNEARAMRAAAIVLPLPRRRGGALFGPVLGTVLAERPCRVIIEVTPAPDDGASAMRARQAEKA